MGKIGMGMMSKEDLLQELGFGDIMGNIGKVAGGAGKIWEAADPNSY